MNVSTLEEAFDLTKKFTSKPSNDDLLKLYSLYKQATEGDNQNDPPAGFDFVAAAKHNAWAKIKGMNKEEAVEKYISLVNQLSVSHI
jgi:acyl-CoA-binding protein